MSYVAVGLPFIISCCDTLPVVDFDLDREPLEEAGRKALELFVEIYRGLVNSSPLPGAVLGDLLISALNNNAGAAHQNPANPSPILSAGTVYALSREEDNEAIRAVELSTGRSLWRARVSGAIRDELGAWWPCTMATGGQWYTRQETKG